MSENLVDSTDEKGKNFNDYIVVFKENMLAGASKEVYKTLEQTLNITETFHHGVHGFKSEFSEEIRIDLEKHPNIDYIVQDRIVNLPSVVFSKTNVFQAKSIPINKHISWGVEAVHPFLAKRKHTCNINVENASVYILDTGVQTDNRDLNVQSHVSFVDRHFVERQRGKHSNNNSIVNENSGHATHVAGIIGKKDTDESKGFTGVAPGIAIHSVEVLDQYGSGFLSWILKGIEHCVKEHTKPENKGKTTLVNMSLGFESRHANERNPLDDAIIHATQQGLIFVVAAGNSSHDVKFDSPAHNSSSVITVGAYNQNRQFCDFSNFGSQIDVCAPGEEILSTWPHNDYRVMSGTSMAAPHITGLVALFLSKHPYARIAEVKTFLKENQVPLTLKNLRGNTPSHVVSLKSDFSFAYSFHTQASIYYPELDITKKKMINASIV